MRGGGWGVGGEGWRRMGGRVATGGWWRVGAVGLGRGWGALRDR